MHKTARIVGGVMILIGSFATLAIDILASAWVAAEHGFGWVIVSWGFMVPLLVIPFLAGLGVQYILAFGFMLAGMGLGVWGEEEGR